MKLLEKAEASIDSGIDPFAIAYYTLLCDKYPGSAGHKEAIRRGIPGTLDGFKKMLAEREAAFKRIDARLGELLKNGVTEDLKKFLKEDPDYQRYKDTAAFKRRTDRGHIDTFEFHRD